MNNQFIINATARAMAVKQVERQTTRATLYQMILELGLSPTPQRLDIAMERYDRVSNKATVN